MIAHSRRGLGLRALGASSLLLLSSTLAMAGCSILETSDSGDNGLVSNRPQTDKYFSAIVRLPTAPLLDTAAPDANGVMVIDRTAAARIATEQKGLIDRSEEHTSELQ